MQWHIRLKGWVNQGIKLGCEGYIYTYSVIPVTLVMLQTSLSFQLQSVKGKVENVHFLILALYLILGVSDYPPKENISSLLADNCRGYQYYSDCILCKKFNITFHISAADMGLNFSRVQVHRGQPKLSLHEEQIHRRRLHTFAFLL